MRSLLPCLLLACLSCATPRSSPALDASAPHLTPPPPLEDAGHEESAPGTPLEPALEAEAQSTLSRLAAVRGLALRGPLPRVSVSREQVREQLLAALHRERAAEELRYEGELYRRLGWLPDGFDYERVVVDLLEEQLGGFYSFEEGRLYLVQGASPSMVALVLSHELVHALQFQNFRLADLLRHRTGDGDRELAARSILEGDAMLTSTLERLYAAHLASMNGAQRRRTALPSAADLPPMPRLRAAPRALQEFLLFPYLAGANLCGLAWRARGFRAVDVLLQRPPASTEQLLHPERLTAQDLPMEVSERYAMLGMRRAHHDVLGELGLRLYLEGLPEAEVQRAAAGWGGDRAMLFLPDGDDALSGSAVVWRILFDNGEAGRREQEAVEFEAAARRAQGLRYRAGQGFWLRSQRGVARKVWRVSEGRVSAVVRRGREVQVFEAVPRFVLEDIDGVP